MKKIILFLLTSFCFLQEECEDNRYINEIFDVDIEYEVLYGENVNQSILGSEYSESLYIVQEQLVISMGYPVMQQIKGKQYLLLALHLV